MRDIISTVVFQGLFPRGQRKIVGSEEEVEVLLALRCGRRHRLLDHYKSRVYHSLSDFYSFSLCLSFVIACS